MKDKEQNGTDKDRVWARKGCKKRNERNKKRKKERWGKKRKLGSGVLRYSDFEFCPCGKWRRVVKHVASSQPGLY
jgi:hypothetical protein